MSDRESLEGARNIESVTTPIAEGERLRNEETTTVLQRAWDSALAAEYKFLRRKAGAILLNDALADDVTNEVFERLLRRVRRDPTAYTIDGLRRLLCGFLANVRKEVRRADSRVEFTDDIESCDVIASGEPQAIASIELRRLLALLEREPEGDVELLVVSALGGEDASEEGSATPERSRRRQRVHRLRDRLRDCPMRVAPRERARRAPRQRAQDGATTSARRDVAE
ncbi:MAG: hypothetical protein ACHREM_07140 [Polyangiales bacterium]